MPLSVTSVEPLVDRWSSVGLVSWTATEKAMVVDALLELSALVTPRVVPDEPRAMAREQDVLLARTIAALEAWLGRAAAALRRDLGIDTPMLVPGTTRRALGLRSATRAELEALPGVGDELADAIAHHLALHPELADVGDLLEVDGIGTQRLGLLRRLTYLDRPRIRLVSPSLWSFALEPRVETYLELLEQTDLVLSFGDHTALERRMPTLGLTMPQRLTQTLALVAEHTQHQAAMVDGVLASEALRSLERHERRAAMLGRLSPVSGKLLVNASYVSVVEDVIHAATSRVSLLMFLGTTAIDTAERPGPLALIEALEAARDRGVQVRVILDQDDGGEPYGSAWINRPLLQRLRDSGVEARFDREDVLLHSKVLAVDRYTVVVGSHNWTRTGFHDAQELSVLLRGEAVAQAFEARFDALWHSLPG
ncbi:phospholipase D-like domain-containing protein [Paraliomyxa miuraensis]|uniref:phospholipase D-like domain-containing protein n=1 Tax=Paraliomyxa miuraensis TaxID=376150 RepID=UPI002256CEF2|nr:phospholipase D-like domain-containing protein [Paraliomyxa miuraensis]MCX4240478.1 phospholipase D-like domain-containing protein [Paraliomyxa miuraensis]